MDLMTPTTTTYLSRLITAYLMKEQDEGNHIAFLGIVTDDDWKTSRVYDEVIPPLKVIALDFTNSARARIESAGGKCLSINQFPLTFKKTFLSGFAKYHDTTMVIFKPNKNNNKRSSSSSSNQTTMRNVRRRIQGGREGDYYSYCIPTTTTPFMDNLNDDLLCEILIRLPAKTLGGLKVINKRWYSFISHPSFVTKHASLQTPRDASTFLFQTYERLVTLLSFDFPSPNLLSETTFTHSLPPDDYGTPTIVPQPKFFASGRGLLIVKTGYNTYIYNPLTKKYKYFPEPYETFYSHYGIIFGESTSSGHNHYTLVSLVEANKAFKFMVFLPNKSRWRDSNKSSMISYGTNGLQIYSICKDIFPVCYRGIMHWLTREGYIIAFNLDKEESRMIEIPKTVMSVSMRGEWWECTWLGVLEDEVILVVATSKHEIVTWVLHDYESNKWTIKRKDVINLKRVPVFYIRPLFFDGQRFLLTISTNIYYKSGHNAHLRLEHDVRTGVSKPLRSEGRTSFPGSFLCLPIMSTLTEV